MSRARLWRIRDRATFTALRRAGHRARSGPIAVTWLPGPAGDPPRVAFAVGRPTGRAVTRNLVRRRLQGALRDRATALPAGAYLISAGPDSADLSYDELSGHFQAAVLAATEGAEPTALSGRSGGVSS